MITRCNLCPGVNACLPPDGPEDASLLFIGEAPGVQENRRGVVFCGKTGDEVNRHYLPLAGLRRESVGFTNAIRCLPVSAGGKLDSGRPKDLALLRSCTAQHLEPHIAQTRPAVLIPLGAFACRAICPDINLDLHHGMPTATRWGIPAFPMYHPARGIHEPKMMLHIRTDWQRLRRFVAGTLTEHVDHYPNPDYQEVTSASDFQELDPTQPLAGDTESTRSGIPFCLTYSQYPGTGRLIRASSPHLLEAFQTHLDHWEAPILFHNWLYDWPVTQAMGLQFPIGRLIDTMVRAYHLGNLPQGLKALAFRELGMPMQDFDDLVSPHSTVRVLKYYRDAYDESWERPPQETVRDMDGQWKIYAPQSMKTKLKRFFTDYTKNPEKDVFAMFEDNWEAEQGALEEKCGPYPGKCITHVPFEEILPYACRDADALIRLWPILRRMSTLTRRFSQEHWVERANLKR